MISYLFVLGRTPKFALLELQVFFPKVSLLSDECAILESSDPIDAASLLAKLGGTVKIACIVKEASSLDTTTLASCLPTDSDITFGVSVYGEGAVERALLHQLKKYIEGQGRKARFIESPRGETLSSVVIEKNHVSELIAVKKVDTYVIAQTVAVQDFEAWGKRDFGRPHADAKAGMLPPKVARMAVNLATPTYAFSQKTLLDPFCGMGTILAEGLTMGWSVIGSDISKQVIQKAHENVSWLLHSGEDHAGTIQKMVVSEAVHIASFLPPASVDAIVTEPYMGSTSLATKTMDAQGIRNTIKGLEKLYIGCLRNWHEILKPGGKIVIALPEYSIHSRTYFVKKVVDMCENLGYTIVEGPIDYSRPQATVKREFYIFQKKK